MSPSLNNEKIFAEQRTRGEWQICGLKGKLEWGWWQVWVVYVVTQPKHTRPLCSSSCLRRSPVEHIFSQWPQWRNLQMVVVVSRWFGGILLGPDRFKHINNSARCLLDTCGYIKGSGQAGSQNDKQKLQSKGASQKGKRRWFFVSTDMKVKFMCFQKKET